MNELFRQALSLIEADVQWLNDAGQHCEDLSKKYSQEEQAKAKLVAEVYRERARVHRDLAARMHKQLKA
jgi:hypothetical protein